MIALKLLLRLAISLVLGWFGTALILWIVSVATGISLWGLFHSGAPLLGLLVVSVALFWILGKVRWFSRSTSA